MFAFKETSSKQLRSLYQDGQTSILSDLFMEEDMEENTQEENEKF